MHEQKTDRIVQIRGIMERDKKKFFALVAMASLGYAWAGAQGSVERGWVAFVVAVALSFSALLVAISLATSELEANLLEGPRTD